MSTFSKCIKTILHQLLHYFRAIKNKNKHFFKQKFNDFKNDNKNTCRAINSISGNKLKTNCNFLLIEDELKSEPPLLANHFNLHFTTVADKLLYSFSTGSSNYCNYLNSASAQSIYFWPTCPSEIANMLQKMKNKLCAGIDQMPTTVLKAILDNILIALSHAFNLSLSRGSL